MHGGEVKAVSEAFEWLQELYRDIVFVTDSMSMLAKIQKGWLHADWATCIQNKESTVDFLPQSCRRKGQRDSRRVSWDGGGKGQSDTGQGHLTGAH